MLILLIEYQNNINLEMLSNHFDGHDSFSLDFLMLILPIEYQNNIKFRNVVIHYGGHDSFS